MLKKKAKNLEPLIGKHFQKYVEEYISPLLPEDYKFTKIDCKFSIEDKGYELFMKHTKTEEIKNEYLNNMDKVMGLLQEYMLKYPLVSEFHIDCN